jgi:hypothetical protein
VISALLCKGNDFFMQSKSIIGKIGVPDHPVPIFVDHHIYLSIYKERWSVCSGADWSKCPACPHMVDRIILWTNYISNDFGLNWFFALAWLIGLTLIWYTSIKLCLGYTCFDYKLIADEVGRFLLFINPIHQFDKLFEIGKMNTYLGGALFFDGISRITGAYLLYQFVSAFRKYSKK